MLRELEVWEMEEVNGGQSVCDALKGTPWKKAYTACKWLDGAAKVVREHGSNVWEDLFGQRDGVGGGGGYGSGTSGGGASVYW
jgi:hypothetical protein